MNRSVMLVQINEATNTAKAYQVSMDERADGWSVSAHNGRIGSSLKEQQKGSGLTLDAANALFDKTVSAKLKGGYVQEGGTVAVSAVGSREILTGMVPMRPTPFDLESLDNLDGMGWLVQRKHDGENRPVMADAGGVTATNRNGQPVGMRQEVINQITRLREIVGDVRFNSEDMGDDGLIVFDVIFGAGVKEGDDFESRNRGLAAIAEAVRTAGLSLIGYDVAMALEDFLEIRGPDFLRDSGAEGFVLKRRDASYAPGRVNNAAKAASLKIKFTEDATLRVAPSRNPDRRSVGIESWEPDTDEWVSRGNVTIPEKTDMPAPGDLIDVEYLYITGARGALIQPVYKRPRPDATPQDCDGSRLKLKGGAAPAVTEDGPGM